MKDKPTWQMGKAGIVGGGLDALMILAALQRIEAKLNVLLHRKRRRRGSSDPCPPTEARL
ncbi:MAG: hypothetical protein M0D55_15420 [Elusimicrobiota bacterium]|nr:MAG: hypothetical protein M0D55_15420 [Elusimicrobiota bacterium]